MTPLRVVGSRLGRILSLCWLIPAAAGTAQTLPDPSTLGPGVGQRVPAFSATDQAGTTRTLESLTGPEGLMLVFFRSAEW